ncbi:MAG: hypothetical protein LBK76_11585 [Verrucomicrobiales bacterium]|jgi:hypothetical protein|nr:hypothetical protein [Verrucomicrobiales bacterium]
MNEYIYTLRIPEELRQNLLENANKVGISHTNLVKRGIKAICNHIERYGQITMPFELASALELEMLKVKISQLKTSLARGNSTISAAPAAKKKSP